MDINADKSISVVYNESGHAEMEAPIKQSVEMNFARRQFVVGRCGFCLEHNITIPCKYCSNALCPSCYERWASSEDYCAVCKQEGWQSNENTLALYSYTLSKDGAIDITFYSDHTINYFYPYGENSKTCTMPERAPYKRIWITQLHHSN